MSLQESLRQIQLALRAGRVDTADGWITKLLERFPQNNDGLYLLGLIRLAQNKLADSIAIIEDVLARVPEFAQARVDLARAYRADHRPGQAREEVRRVLEKWPHHHRAWLAYGDILVDLEQYPDASVAFEHARLSDPKRLQIDQATQAMLAGDRKGPEQIFRVILQEDPSHVAALCGLAALSLAADVPNDAERLLRHALKQSPHLPLAWRGLAPTLLALGRLEEARTGACYLTRIEPENPQSWVAIAAVDARLLRQERALSAYERAAQLNPGEPRLLMSIGHVHKTLGKRPESEAAYKAALTLDPTLGEAYWSLADLKNYTFSDAEVSAMGKLLEDANLPRGSQAQVHFAMGKALEQRGEYAEAFAHYAQGNAQRRLDAPFDAAGFEKRTSRIIEVFDTSFFRERSGWGHPSPAPIFIVGLPRSGSTLVEQILASHSRVEGTMELPNILNIVRVLDDLSPDRNGYPQSARTITPERASELGRLYIEETAPLRLGRERFTDKLPNNFSHVGLIQAILPGATIIDARRHPMDCCYSTFKQHFAEGQTFSYDLEDLGRYYRCYLALMDHWDTVLPGKVLHVQYEELVRDPETGIRRLLEHCGLPFESACIEFHRTRRSVRTASAEQVRQPIYASSIGHWRHFEKELEPLRAALGDSLTRFTPFS